MEGKKVSINPWNVVGWITVVILVFGLWKLCTTPYVDSLQGRWVSYEGPLKEIVFLRDGTGHMKTEDKEPIPFCYTCRASNYIVLALDCKHARDHGTEFLIWLMRKSGFLELSGHFHHKVVTINATIVDKGLKIEPIGDEESVKGLLRRG